MTEKGVIMAEEINNIAKLIGSISVIAGALISAGVWVHKINAAMKCLLRSEVLRIYFAHDEVKEITRYEYENAMFLYAAYKALHGNSFVDKIVTEVKTWKVKE